MSISRTKNVLQFMFLWLMCWIVWSYTIRAFSAHHGENAAVQGLAADTIA